MGKTREIARRRLGVRGVRRKAQGSRKNRKRGGTGVAMTTNYHFRPRAPQKRESRHLSTPLHPTPPLAVWIFLGRLPLESDATTPEFFPPRGENLSLSPPIPLSHPRSTAVPSVECAQRRPFVAGFSPPFCRYGWLARRRHCRRPSRRLVPRVPDFKGSSCSAHHLSTAPTS